MNCQKDLAFFTSENSTTMSNLSKETTNVESKSNNNSGIQDESPECEKYTDFLFNILKHHSNKIGSCKYKFC